MYNPFFLFVGSLLFDLNPPKRQAIRLPSPLADPKPIFEHTRIAPGFFEERSVGEEARRHTRNTSRLPKNEGMKGLLHLALNFC